MFEIKQHNSGEVEVTLTERLRLKEKTATIKWNYFEQKDIMIPLLQAAAIRYTYGFGTNLKIILDAPYLPYARQDRVFHAGQPVAFEVFLQILGTQFQEIRTMALHCSGGDIHLYYPPFNIAIKNVKYNAMALQSEYNIVFPDESARNHYYYPDAKMYTFVKNRNKEGAPNLTFDQTKLPEEIYIHRTFLICDDIGDGNRTFAACAEALKKSIFMNSGVIKIELMLYHAFGSYGLQNIIDAGISKLKIINPDSYHFLINKFPEHKDFIELVTFKGQ